MKMRKILSRAIAIASCVAMLSTSVLAASELTITAGENGGLLKATISGNVSGQVTFLAVDKDATVASVADADIQYIAQEEKAQAADTVIQFAQRTGGDNRVDLYAGGMSVTEVAHLKGVYVVNSITANAASVATVDVTAANVPADNAGWEALLYDKVKVDSVKIGATAPEVITLNASTAADFDVAATQVDEDSYTLNVSYKSTPVSTVAAEVVANITGITVTQNSVFDYYIDAGATFDAARAKSAIIASGKVTAVASTDGEPLPLDLADLTYVVEGTGADTKVALSYSGHTAATKVAINVITRKVTGVQTSAGAVRVSFADLGALDIASVTADMVTNYVKNNVARANFAPKYTWNDPEKLAEAVPTSNYSYETAVLTGDGAEEDVYTVVVKAAAAKDDVTAGAVLGNIEVTVTAVTRTLITGSVTVADSTQQVTEDFAGAIPVGAVVTAIKYNAEMMGNYTGTADAFEAVSTVVDASGNFTLEVEPGTYTVIIAHAKYVIIGGELMVSRTVVDANSMKSVTIAEGATENLGAVALKYTYFGDMNLDGTLNGVDFATFKDAFGSSVN